MLNPMTSCLLLSTLFLVAAAVVSTLPAPGLAQNCGCGPGLCCNKYGYCGNTTVYCGASCQAGPCVLEPTNGVSVTSIVTDWFFDGIIRQAAPNFSGHSFYSRKVFLEALRSYDRISRGGPWMTPSMRSQLSSAMSPTKLSNYYDSTSTEYPCAAGKEYFDQVSIQLLWNFNYDPTGRSIGFDGLKAPERVSEDPVVSFKTTLWYWTGFIHPVIRNGFRATIRAINGALKCDGANPATVRSHVRYYTNYCTQFSVSPDANLTC